MSAQTFGDDAFERARVRWEAPRKIAALEARLQASERAHAKRRQAIKNELARWEEIAHPAKFRAAFEAAGDNSYRLYWNLRHGGVSNFEEASVRTDAELLAIDGIDPVSLGLIRQVLGAARSEVGS